MRRNLSRKAVDHTVGGLFNSGSGLLSSREGVSRDIRSPDRKEGYRQRPMRRAERLRKLIHNLAGKSLGHVQSRTNADSVFVSRTRKP